MVLNNMMPELLISINCFTKSVAYYLTCNYSGIDSMKLFTRNQSYRLGWTIVHPCCKTHARYGIRVFQCIYQTTLKLFKRGVFEQYLLGTVTTRQGQSPICQLSLKGAPNCASRIFGKCKTLSTSYTIYYQSSAGFHTVWELTTPYQYHWPGLIDLDDLWFRGV